MKIKITLLLFLFSSFYANSQCSMCRAVIESQEGQELAEGINDGIKYLMIIPYILVGFVGWKIYKTLKSN
ncbi:MAG: hypothetical protein P8K14_02560 [Flavobacteriaceae bacterium]|jgi:hypothetical protein|nr:hypothetical protein [Flavobacteriaceae bacterium]